MKFARRAASSGRPSKFDKRDKFLDFVREGYTLAAASGLAGIDRTTIHRWLATGSRARRGQFRDFFNAYQDAQRVAEATLTKIIFEGCRTDYRFALQVAEWRFPEHWSLKERREITGPEGAPLQVEITSEVVKRFAATGQLVAREAALHGNGS